jgi:hypothetical protein
MERLTESRHELHNVVSNASYWQIYVVNVILEDAMEWKKKTKKQK